MALVHVRLWCCLERLTRHGAASLARRLHSPHAIFAGVADMHAWIMPHARGISSWLHRRVRARLLLLCLLPPLALWNRNCSPSIFCRLCALAFAFRATGGAAAGVAYTARWG